MAESLTKGESKKLLAKMQDDLYKPIKKHDAWSEAWLWFLVIVIIVGLYGWYIQIRDGLGVTAMRDYVSWGLYISNFVFFVAVSLIGSLISSMMHLLRFKWITPVSRIAEQIAVAAVALAGIIIVTDMGRPDRVLNVFLNGRFASPILWDVTVITTYLAISVLLIWLPLIPDIAMMKQRMTDIPKWKYNLYNILSMGWEGSEKQYKKLKRNLRILMILIIPVALAIHTVTSWLFAATLRPGWDTTIFGPYFVTGAFVAGAAAVIILMYVYRQRYRLKEYLTDYHFDQMGKVVVFVSLVYLYFNINEYLVPAYKMKEMDGHHLRELFYGKYAIMFWSVQLGGLIIPIILLLFRFFRKPLPAFIISLFVLIGAFFKRYIIVVPTLQHPHLPIQNVPDHFHTYVPTGIEIMITAASFAAALLIITFLAKMFPVMSVWELAEEKGVKREDLLD